LMFSVELIWEKRHVLFGMPFWHDVG